MGSEILMNKLKQLREERRLTQEKLSNAVGIDRTTISKVESGERELTLDHLQRLSKYFEVSYDYLLGKSQERKNKYTVTEVSNSGITKVQMEFLKRIEDLNVKDMEQVFDYIDFLKHKGENNK